MKILILFAHPNLDKSMVNKLLIDNIQEIGDVKIHDLYQVYPDFDIDIEQEQRLLSEHDCIIFQYPLFWYSTPSILKEWQDLVLEHGWAYGREANALKGKYFLNVITSGGPRSGYSEDGFHKNTLTNFISPLRQMAKLCGMTYLPPFVIHGTHKLNTEQVHKEKLIYHTLLEDFSKEKLDLKELKSYHYLNDYLINKEG